MCGKFAVVSRGIWQTGGYWPAESGKICRRKLLAPTNDWPVNRTNTATRRPCIV